MNTPSTLQIILHELEEIRLAKQHLISDLDGLHVTPSQLSLLVLHGVVFVRTGPYAGGKYQCKVYLLNSIDGCELKTV